ncbi:hypothetical protein IWZ00DRAFT_534031 [Phyllosticta capitalensis]
MALNSPRSHAILPKPAADSGGDGQPLKDDRDQNLPTGHGSSSFHWKPVEVMAGICCRCGYSKHVDTWRQCKAECFICHKDKHHGQECPEQQEPNWYGDNGPLLGPRQSSTAPSSRGNLSRSPSRSRNFSEIRSGLGNFPVAPSGSANVSVAPHGSLSNLSNGNGKANFPQDRFDQPKWSGDPRGGPVRSHSPTCHDLAYHNPNTAGRLPLPPALGFGLGQEALPALYNWLLHKVMELERNSAQLRAELERDRQARHNDSLYFHGRISRLENMLSQQQQQQKSAQQPQVKLEDQEKVDP